MATKKKLDFDFSKFGCNEDAVKELTEAMGFEAVKDKGTYVSPLDKVKRRDGKILLVVTRELHGLEFGDCSTPSYIPVVEEPFQKGGAPWVNGISPDSLTTLNGEKILGFKD